MLKLNEGFHSYLLVKNDGIVIKYDKMSYDEAKQWAYNVLDLATSTAKYVRELLAPDEVCGLATCRAYLVRPADATAHLPQNQIQNIRLRCFNFRNKKYQEVIVAQTQYYTFICIQHSGDHHEHEEDEEEEEEGAA